MVIRSDFYGFTRWDKKQMKKDGKFQRLSGFGDFGSSPLLPTWLNPANYTLFDVGPPIPTNTLPPSSETPLGEAPSLLEGNNKYYLAGAAALAAFFLLRKR